MFWSLLRIVFLYFCIVNFAFSNEMNDKSKKAFYWGLRNITSLSYTGYQNSVSFDAKYKSFNFYLGPSLSLSDAYLPWKSSYGFHTGSFYNLPVNSAFIAINGFHLQYLKGKFSDQNSHSNHTWEAFFTTGSGYNWQNFDFILTMGFGAFYERFYDNVIMDYNFQNGYNFLISFHIAYQIYN